MVVFWVTAAMIPLGVFVCVGGTYGVVVQIKDAYGSGRIGEFTRFDGDAMVGWYGTSANECLGSAFSCEDNSGTTAS